MSVQYENQTELMLLNLTVCQLSEAHLVSPLINHQPIMNWNYVQVQLMLALLAYELNLIQSVLDF